MTQWIDSEIYLEAMEAIGVGLLRADAKSGQILFVNDLAMHLLKLQSDCISNLDYVGVLASLRIEKVMDVRLEAKKHGFVRFEAWFGEDDETATAIEATLYHKPERHTQTEQFIIFMTDISERKRQEQKLRQYAHIFQSSNDAIIGTNQNGFVVNWNQGATDLFGYSAEEMLGQSLWRLSCQDAVAEDKKVFGQAVNKGWVKCYDTICRHKNGSFIWVAVTLSPIRNDQDVIVGVSQIAHDITERKSIEQKNQQLIAIINDSSDFIFMAKPDGDLIYVNPAGINMMGRQNGQVATYLQFISFYSETLHAVVLNHIIPAVLEKGEWQGELAICHQEGFEIPVLVSACAHHIENDNDVIMSVVMRDIRSEKEKQRALLEAKEAAEAANQAIALFVAQMSHELRTPLNVMLGFNQVLQTMLSDDKSRLFLQKSSQAGEHLLHLINEILDYEKLCFGDIQVNEQPMLLHEVVSTIEDTLRMGVQDRPIEAIIKLDETLPDALIGDAVRLNQVLLNLISNAVKFTERGKIVFSINQLARQKDRIVLEFEVRDTGIGVAPDVIPRLFKVFEQGRLDISQRYGGAGLGLAVSQKLVELMGGKLAVESQLHKGSRFFFSIGLLCQPLEKQSSLKHALQQLHYFQQTEEVPLNERVLQGMGLLVVDDNSLNLDVAEELLERIGADVMTASNGQEAIDCFTQNRDRIHAILMDIQMPVMDGYEATQIIRELPGGELPIIAVTAHAAESDQKLSEQQGMDGHITKPFSMEKLSLLLKQKLGQHDLIPIKTQIKPQRQLPVLDSLSAINHLGGFKDIWLNTIQIFLRTYPEQWQALQEAIQSHRAQQAARRCHQFASSTRTLGLTQFSETLLSVEKMLLKQKEVCDFTGVEQLLNQQLQQALSELHKVLKQEGCES